MSQLPVGWERLCLGELVDIKYGKGLRAADRSGTGEAVVMGSAGISGTHKTSLSPGPAIVVGRKGNVGEAHLSEGPVWPIDTTYYFEVPEDVSPRFLWYQIGGLGLERLDSSTAVPSLRRPDLESANVVIPPYVTQQRIVEVIEEQFSKLDAGVASLHRAKRNLARLRVSILQSGVEGRLTASDAGSWDTKLIGQLGLVGSGATPKRGNKQYWVGGTIPWVTSGQLNASVVTEPADLITERALAETSVRIWPAGTILVAMYGEGKTRGKCSELAFPSTTNQACAAIVLNEEFEHIRPFLKLFLTARYEQTRRLASGGVQPNLSLGLIKSIAVPIPLVSEQVRIVEEAERLLSVVESLDAELEIALKRSQLLRQSTLKAAFVGRLASSTREVA